jgi:hypothetical protein
MLKSRKLKDLWDKKYIKVGQQRLISYSNAVQWLL